MTQEHQFMDDAIEYIKKVQKVRVIAKKILTAEWDKIGHNPFEPMDISPWDDIAYSMLRNPDLVTFEFDSCPICNMRRIQFYYQPLGGQHEGKFCYICPSCQNHFGLSKPNSADIQAR